MTRQSADWNKTLFHWKAGLAYQIVNQPQLSVSLIKPFFNISQGKIAPDVYRLNSAATNKLEPETIFMIDAGIQMSFLQEKIEVTPTFFYHNIKDRVVYISRAPFITANTDQKSTGIELETKVFVGYGFSLQGSYTYQDLSPPKTGPQSIEAQRLPENMFKTSLNWNGWQPLNVNVAFVSIGQRNYSTDSKNLKYLPSYELLNLAISYQVIQELKLFVRVDNFWIKNIIPIDLIKSTLIDLICGVDLNFNSDYSPILAPSPLNISFFVSSLIHCFLMTL